MADTNLVSRIKNIAIYSRKSRVEETEMDMQNHRFRLENICKKYGWNYTIYEEEKSTTSQEIDVRDAFNELLTELKSYQAVIVIELQRLTRNMEDAAKIKRIFIQNSIFLVMQETIWDLTDPIHSRMYDIQSFLGNMEYADIVSRLMLGKRLRAEQGFWSNGPPPFGYSYDRNTRSLLVNPVEAKVYEYAKSRFLNDEWGLNQICWDLNRKGKTDPSWLTRKNRVWKNKVLNDVLTNMVHMGVIVVGKSQGTPHKDRQTKSSRVFKTIDRDEWEIFQGKHTALKTEEEHMLIVYRLQKSGLNNSRTLGQVKSRNVFPLTGLVQCGLCGRTLGMYARANTGELYLKRCPNIDPYGNKCLNSSIGCKYIEESLLDEIREQEKIVSQIVYQEKYITELTELREKQIAEIAQRQSELQAELKRISDAFAAGVFSLDEFAVMKRSRTQELYDLEVRLSASRMKEDELVASLETTRINRYKQILEEYYDATAERKNELLKGVVDRIIFTRPSAKQGDSFELKINFKE